MKRRAPLDAENGFADHGGYMAAKITKLEEQFSTIQSACSKKSTIFEGVSIFVNGLTNPSADWLKMAMMEHSGTFHHYQRSHTKFVVANNLPDVKIRSNITRNIVKPDWIVDSIKENRLLDYSKYLLYTNKNKAQPQIQFKAAEKKETVDPFASSLQALNMKMNDETKAEAANEIEESKTGTAVDPNFLQEFLSNSRLHHIATLGAGFKFHINDLRKNHDGKFPLRDGLKAKLAGCESIPQSEVIMHIDIDCFFVSVSIKNHPHLKGQPVAVTHSKGKAESKTSEDFKSYSEIASCSYEAREKGLKNGMFVGAALKLCPELKTIPYDFEEYKKTAFTLYNTIAQYTLDIEAVSCDEMYVDLKSLLVDCQMDVMEFVTLLRQEILDKTGCNCSVGIGSNRLQARMATKEAKPNGQFSLLSVDVEEYMKDKKIRELPGVGPNTSYLLKQLNLETCGQLQNLPVQLLQQSLGKKFAETLLMMSSGIDDKKLVFEQVRKSASVEVNYGIRFNEDVEVHTFLKQVADELSKRLKEINKKGKALSLRLMIRAKDASVDTLKFMGHGLAEKTSKSMALLASTDDPITIHINVLKLLAAFNVPAYELRGIGVQMSKLDEDKKDSKLLELFRKQIQRQSDAPPMDFRTKVVTSPVKVKITSPKKKRGRPSKLTSSSKATPIADLFTAKKNTLRSFKRTVEMIDPDVLSELPPEMVDEILKEYEIPDEDVKEDEQSTHDESFESLKSDATSESSSDNIFLRDDWRNIVKSWIDDGDEDSKGKIQHDAAQLVRLEELDLLYIVMRFLHRNIDEKEDSTLHNLYNDTAQTVQAEMFQSYSRKLLIPKEF